MAFEDTALTVIIPVISSAVTILIFVITRARSQGDTSTITAVNVSSVMKTLEDRRDEEKERDKDLKGEMRDMNKNIQDLVSAINLHTHILGENKQTIVALQDRLQEMERQLSRVERSTVPSSSNNKGAIQSG